MMERASVTAIYRVQTYYSLRIKIIISSTFVSDMLYHYYMYFKHDFLYV